MVSEPEGQGGNCTFFALPSGAIRESVMPDDHSLYPSGAPVHLKRHAPANPDRKIAVDLTNSGAFCTGDSRWDVLFPFIDCSIGGIAGL
jgi:hypothetical protein